MAMLGGLELRHVQNSLSQYTHPKTFLFKRNVCGNMFNVRKTHLIVTLHVDYGLPLMTVVRSLNQFVSDSPPPLWLVRDWATVIIWFRLLSTNALMLNMFGLFPKPPHISDADVVNMFEGRTSTRSDHGLLIVVDGSVQVEGADLFVYISNRDSWYVATSPCTMQI